MAIPATVASTTAFESNFTGADNAHDSIEMTIVRWARATTCVALLDVCGCSYICENVQKVCLIVQDVRSTAPAKAAQVSFAPIDPSRPEFIDMAWPDYVDAYMTDRELQPSAVDAKGHAIIPAPSISVGHSWPYHNPKHDTVTGALHWISIKSDSRSDTLAVPFDPGERRQGDHFMVQVMSVGPAIPRSHFDAE